MALRVELGIDGNPYGSAEGKVKKSSVSKVYNFNFVPFCTLLCHEQQ